MAIDAHAHVFQRGLPLAAERRYTPNYDAPLERYLKHLDQHGLSHGILVQPSFLGTDNSYLVESLTQAGDRLRGIAVVDLGVSRHELLRLAQAGVVGIRLNLLGRPLPDLSTRPWRVLLDMVATLGWHVEIQRDASGLVNLVPQLLDAGVPVVLDHFGLPDPRWGAADPAFQQLLKLGKSQKVWVKISASYRNGVDGERLARQLFPRLREEFGLQRLMWGSDWPHTQFENEQTYENSRIFLTVLAGDGETVAEILAAPRELFLFQREACDPLAALMVGGKVDRH